MKIVISAGHGLHIRGASGSPVPPQLDEVDEARRMVPNVAEYLRDIGVEVVTYWDDVSRTQSENLHRIVDFHNAQGAHDLDVSIHFNAYNGSARGTECLYITQAQLAAKVSAAIAQAGQLTDRGGKKRTDLYFLNNTAEPAILIETCFCDNTADANLYRANFDLICQAIAQAVAGEAIKPPQPQPPDDALFEAAGTCSWFGGPEDDGVSPSEGLAFIYSYDQRPDLFLPQQPPGTTGLARRLNPEVFYVACRWDYDATPKDMLADPRWMAIVRANGREFQAWPADWGPHADTGRVADLSPGLMEALQIETDDSVEIVYPIEADQPEPEDIPTVYIDIKVESTGRVKVVLNGTEIPADQTGGTS